jgi:hypothetical protein
VDLYRLSELAGVPYHAVLEKWPRLREANLVYPDGSISESALKVIRSEIAGKLFIPKMGGRHVAS